MPRRDTDPYGNFRFKLELDAVLVGGFSECTGLQAETKIFEYKEGGNNQTTLKFPENTTYANVVLKRGISSSNVLMDWHADHVKAAFQINPRSRTKGTKPKIAIVLLDEKDDTTAVKRWNLVNAFPVKWAGPELKAAGNEMAIETLEIAHEGIERTA